MNICKPLIPRSSTRLVALVTLAASAGALWGCAAGGISASPNYDARFGAATRVTLAQQTADTAAGQRNGQKVPPADGKAVRESVDRFVDSFRAPPPNNVIQIGVK